MCCGDSWLPVSCRNHSHESPSESWAETDSLICVKWQHAEGSAGFLCQTPDHDSLVFLLHSLCFLTIPHITEDRSLKLHHVTFKNHLILCHSGAHVQVMISWLSLLKLITHFNIFYWICNSLKLNFLAPRKEQTPGVSLHTFNSHLRHCSFSWCWEMKFIRVSGKGYSLIYGIMPSKSSAERKRIGENKLKSTLEWLSQVSFISEKHIFR